MPKTTCSINGCEKDSVARGWCPTHWARWRKHGDPLTVLRTGPERKTALEREATQRNWRLQRNYGITTAQYDEMDEAQDGKCALCQTTPQRRRTRNNGTPWRGLVVDHDHETGRVRGLLCTGCNIAMGRVDKVGLDTIATYLT